LTTETGHSNCVCPEVIDALKAFGNWIKDHHGDIIGFFKEAGDSLKISQIQLAARQHFCLSAGLRANPLVMGALAVAAASHASMMLR
jgi:hypothetical protein